MDGFHGRLLHVDLTSGRSQRLALEETRLRRYLGGIGLGTSLLYDFAPENPLILTSAPLVGTGLTTTAKFAVVTKSPLTGFIGDSLSSSHFALELKRAGIDALVITGRAASPVYLCITEQTLATKGATQAAAASAR
jgi:aldehyde:ferredoxin oxidoreductase